MAGGKVDRQVEWMRIRGLLRAEYGDGIFKSWLKPMSLEDRGAQGVVVQLPTRFMRDRVQGSYGERIRALWMEADPALAEVVFEVNSVLHPMPVQAAARPAPAGIGKPDEFATPLQPLLTFENFVVGESNQLAFRLCLGLAEGDAQPSGPLYLFGGVGLGKTHLMQALALRLRRDRPGVSILYLSSDDFRQHYINAVNGKNVAGFRGRVRSCDVLMVDDVHLLSPSTGTQEELLHTINALANRGRLMVISGTSSSVGLDGIDERIRSWLSMGESAPILGLETDYPLRLAFLERKASEMAVPVPEEVTTFLAERIASNMRVLQGAMNRLESHVRHFGGELSVDRAEKVLADLLPANDRTPTVEAIKRLVCECYNVRLAEMESPRRAQSIARPRQVAMYLAKQLTQLSLPDIGRRFKRDHSTVLYGIRRIEGLMRDDTALKEEVEALRRKFER